MGNISSKHLKGISPQDTYIILMSDDDRKEAINKGAISQKQVDELQRKGLLLTPDEINKLFQTLTFAMLLFIVAKSSLGKTEFELDRLQAKLEKLNDWIGKLSDAIAHANKLSANKEDKDPKFFVTATELKGLDKVLKELKAEFGDEKINIKDFFKWKKGKEGMSELTPMKPSLAIEKLQNFSKICDNQVKTDSTKISKANNDHNTLLETLSFLAKKFTDTIQGLLQRM